MKPGTSNIQATDEESLLSLTDPTFGVPFDVHFEIEDEEGFILGVVGAHKAVMALRSPVFKAMFYGPLAETGGAHQDQEDLHVCLQRDGAVHA